jgi:hypothetical protein
MKTITTSNWLLVSLYGIILLFSFFNINRRGNDAAGIGMETGLIFFGGILLAVLIGLNIIPYRWSRLTAFSVGLLPVLVVSYNFVSDRIFAYLDKQKNEAIGNGSYYFQDAALLDVASAIAKEDLPRLQTLLQLPVRQRLNESGNDHVTLLDFATFRATEQENPKQAMRCMELLLANGATTQTTDTARIPTQIWVSRQGSAAVLELLLKKGADPNARNSYGAPILFSTIDYETDRFLKVKVLLEQGANPNSIHPDYGWMGHYSPLLYAANNQAWDVCQLLLERGADFRYQTPTGFIIDNVVVHYENLYADNGNTPADFTAFRKKLRVAQSSK